MSSGDKYSKDFLYDGNFTIYRESGKIEKKSKSTSTKLFNLENFVCDKVFLTKKDLILGLEKRFYQRNKKEQIKQKKKQKEYEDKLNKRKF